MKKFFIISLFIIIAYNIAAEINDVYNPSDSGDMKWLNYKITESNAKRGDIKSKWHLLNYYLYNDDLNDLTKGRKIGSLIIEIINDNYGGVKNGGDGIVINLIDECSRKRVINPKDVADAFETIKKTGGGLTPLGKDLEVRWRKGNFSNCPPS